MTVRVITGSKQEIATQLANLNGEVREAIVFLEEPANVAASSAVPATVEELFAEMEPYMAHSGQADYSRESIYSRKHPE